MLSNLYLLLTRLFPLENWNPRPRAMIWAFVYRWSTRIFPMKDWQFMNFGYAPLDDEAEMPELEKIDLNDRYHIQRYHYVASLVDIRNLNVLEVGSGREGGAVYIKRHIQPRHLVA